MIFGLRAVVEIFMLLFALLLNVSKSAHRSGHTAGPFFLTARWQRDARPTQNAIRATSGPMHVRRLRVEAVAEVEWNAPAAQQAR
jgi:hypothetical protein